MLVALQQCISNVPVLFCWAGNKQPALPEGVGAVGHIMPKHSSSLCMGLGLGEWRGERSKGTTQTPTQGFSGAVFNIFFIIFTGTFLCLCSLSSNCGEFWLHHDYQRLQKPQNVQKAISTGRSPNVQKLWSLHLHYVLIQADNCLIAHQENIETAIQIFTHFSTEEAKGCSLPHKRMQQKK